MKKTLAFYSDQSIKDKLIEQLQLHYDLDHIIKGEYWKLGRGCSVGCSISEMEEPSRNPHEKYSQKLNIPLQLAYLNDKIFENLPNELSKEWPISFSYAIKVGSDLDPVWKKFMIWLLIDPEYGVIKRAENKGLVQEIADTYQESISKDISEEKWTILRDTAANVAGASHSNYYSANATYHAVASFSTYYAAPFAVSDADSAYVVAPYVADADSAYGKNGWYIAAADKLIELLEQADVFNLLVQL